MALPLSGEVTRMSAMVSEWLEDVRFQNRRGLIVPLKVILRYGEHSFDVIV